MKSSSVYSKDLKATSSKDIKEVQPGKNDEKNSDFIARGRVDKKKSAKTTATASKAVATRSTPSENKETVKVQSKAKKTERKYIRLANRVHLPPRDDQDLVDIALAERVSSTGIQKVVPSANAVQTAPVGDNEAPSATAVERSDDRSRAAAKSVKFAETTKSAKSTNMLGRLASSLTAAQPARKAEPLKKAELKEVVTQATESVAKTEMRDDVNMMGRLGRFWCQEDEKREEGMSTFPPTNAPSGASDGMLCGEIDTAFAFKSKLDILRCGDLGRVFCAANEPDSDADAELWFDFIRIPKNVGGKHARLKKPEDQPTLSREGIIVQNTYKSRAALSTSRSMTVSMPQEKEEEEDPTNKIKGGILRSRSMTLSMSSRRSRSSRRATSKSVSSKSKISRKSQSKSISTSGARNKSRALHRIAKLL